MVMYIKRDVCNNKDIVLFVQVAVMLQLQSICVSQNIHLYNCQRNTTHVVILKETEFIKEHTG